MIQWLLNILGIQAALDDYEKRITSLEKNNRELRENIEILRTHLMTRRDRQSIQVRREPISLEEKLIGFFNRRPQWNLKISTDRRNLVQFINAHKQITKNTVYGYLITWKGGETTVGYVGESCNSREPHKRPRIILGNCRSIEMHNTAGESILLNDIRRRQGIIDKMVYFVACNTGPYMSKSTVQTLERNLYSTLGGYDGKRILPTGEIVSVEDWIMWLNRQACVPPDLGKSYASWKGGREKSIQKYKGRWVQYASTTGFFV